MVVVAVLRGGDGAPDADPAGLDGALTMITRVEELRGLKFKETPTVAFLDDATLRRRVRAASRAWLRPFGDAVRADDLLATLAGVATREEYVRWLDDQSYVIGFFDVREPRTVFALQTPASGLTDDETEATIAHELTHALEYQHFAAARRLPYGDDGMALAALAEGSAMLVEAMYRREHLGADEELPRLLSTLTDAGPDVPTAGLSLLSSFAYREGADYVHALHRRGGWAAVDAAYEDPPQRSAEILRGGRRVDAAHPALPSAADAGPGWRRLAEVDVGELDTRVLVALEPERYDMADGWAGGRAVVLQRGSGSCRLPCADRTAAVLAWRMRDAAEAEELAAGLERIEVDTAAEVAVVGAEVRMAIAPTDPLAHRLVAAPR